MRGVTDIETQLGMEHPPVASMLMQSLRSVGYSAATALADLIDNSITAQAKTVRIAVTRIPHPYVAVTDDGYGMDEKTLVEAMRFGSRDPRDFRESNDLGRFGLGLKTASLSQCRRLTVASLRGGRLSIARWDLDECDRRRGWWLERPSAEDVPQGPIATLQQQGRGTAIILEELDRLDAAGGDKSILAAADHLALAFHRFLSGELLGPFIILINERPLEVIDPFLEGHARGQTLHDETIMVDGHPIKISPFVLPFPSRLNPGDLERAGGRENLKTSHGFYIYRGGRLVVPGGWFRIVPADDLVRLARIRIDVPVELDHLWKVDIRKAVAEPPQALRPHLRRIVGEVATRSRKVYTHKGTPVDQRDHVPLWKRHDLRDEAAAWRINRDHPIIQWSLSNNLKPSNAATILKLLEDNLPIHDIHIHTVNDRPIVEAVIPEEAEMEAMARQLVAAFAEQPDVAGRILGRLHITEPFSRNPDAARRVAERLQV